MGTRLSDGEKVVVTVFVTLFAGGVGGLFFFGGAMLEMKDAITDVQVSLVEVQRDIADMQQDITDMKQDITELQEDMVDFRAEVSERFDAIDGRISVLERAIETHHGSLSGPAN